MANVLYERDVWPFDSDSDPDNAWTDDVIADELNGQTVNEISIGRARDGFARGGWWYQKNGGEYEGALQSALDNPASPQEVKDTLNKLWTLVFGVSSESGCQTTLQRTTDGALDPNQFAAALHDTLQVLVGQGLITGKQVNRFYAIGGLKYAETDVVSAADVAASRDAWQADQDLSTNKSLLDQEYQRQYLLHIAPIQQSANSADVTDQAYKDALIAMSAGWVDQLS